MDNKKNIAVHFMPGCFDNFEGTQEELDQLIAEIHSMVDSGAMFEHAVLLENVDESDLDHLPASLRAKILNDSDDQPPRTLQ